MSGTTGEVTIELLGPDVAPADVEGLVSLFIGCVDSGASMGYLAPLSASDCAEYWRSIVAELSGGYRVLIVARDAPDGPIVGSAQLVAASRPNGRYRAEVQKVMVRPSHRRRRLGTQLVEHIETIARERRITLLHLDTSEGPSGARELYERLGYSYAGGIPGWALDPDRTPAKNAIFYKMLS